MFSHNAAHLFELMSSDIWQFHSHAATITMTKKIRLWGSDTPTGPIVFASVRCNILPCCLGISLPYHTPCTHKHHELDFQVLLTFPTGSCITLVSFGRANFNRSFAPNPPAGRFVGRNVPPFRWHATALQEIRRLAPP